MLCVSCCVILMLLFVQLCRSQCVALRDHASLLEQRCSSLTSDLSEAQMERFSSLLACALLSGTLSHAHRRLSALSQQKRLLCRRLEEKEQLEEEVRRLAEALGGEKEELERGGGRALRRWRRSVCAVLAVRRWSLLARKTQVVFRVERGGATVCVCADSATAAAKGQDSSQTGELGSMDDMGGFYFESLKFTQTELVSSSVRNSAPFWSPSLKTPCVSGCRQRWRLRSLAAVPAAVLRRPGVHV